LAYSGIYKANPLGGKNGSNASLLQRWNPEDLCSRIVKIHAVSKWITISNIDACELIEELYWMPATTILVDPPYYKQGKNLYKCYYDENDHSRLNMLLENLYHGCPGADIILTYDNVPFIADLYVYPDTEVIGRVYTI
jgi:DNA adenine methylase